METRPGTERGPSYDVSAPAAPPAPEKASIVEDFIDIFYAPSTVFARRENGGFGIHLLIIAALSAVFAFASHSVFSQIFDAEFARGTAKAMAANPRVTPEMMNSMRPIQEKVANVFVYLGAPLAILFGAIFVWVASKIVSAKVTFGKAMLITTLAYVPRLVGGLIGVLQVVLMDTSNFTNRYSLSVSPARFMDPDAVNGKLFGLMGSLEVFWIWSLVLTAIGIAVIGKVPRSKGYLAAVIVFALGTLLTIAFA
jgi:hypothetical protein